MFYFYRIEHCPVCKENLGKRNLKIKFSAVCSECKALYEYEPDATSPKATLLKDLPKETKCGCQVCRDFDR